MPVQFDQGGGVTRNVSATGIYFVTDVALEQGAAVKLGLDFMGLDFKEYPGGPIRVKCTGQGGTKDEPD